MIVDALEALLRVDAILAAVPPTKQSVALRNSLAAIARETQTSAALVATRVKGVAEAAHALVTAREAPPEILSEVSFALSGAMEDRARAGACIAFGTVPASPLRVSEAPGARAVERLPFTLPRDEDDEDEDIEEGDEDPDFDAEALAADDGLEEPLPAMAATAKVPPVRLADGGEARTIEDVRGDVIVAALEALAVLLRARVDAPYAQIARNEARSLAYIDAIAAAGGDVVARIHAWGIDRAGASPWLVAAASFALSSFEGGDALEALAALLESLSEDADAHAVAAAASIALVPHSKRRAFAAHLARSPHPIARAVGVDLLGRERALPAVDVRAFLSDPAPAVVRAAIRAYLRLDDAARKELAPFVEARSNAPIPAIAWPAARALLLEGSRAPYRALLGGRLAIGAFGAELIALVGVADDLALLDQIVSREKIAGWHLDAIARFGHPRSWAFLVHHLADENVAADAADSLATLFGALVPEEKRFDAGAWRAAIAKRKFDPKVRLRGGEPWSPSVVARECASGALSRSRIERRIDELTMRTSVPGAVDLAAWSTEARPALDAALSKVAKITDTSGWAVR